MPKYFFILKLLSLKTVSIVSLKLFLLILPLGKYKEIYYEMTHKHYLLDKNYLNFLI